jgi:hypothetical protein
VSDDASPRDILAQNRGEALDLIQKVGTARTQIILERSERELAARLSAVRISGPTFTSENLRAALAQVREVLNGIRTGMEDVIVGGAADAASAATQGTIDYLGRADAQFRGVGSRPLGLNEASMFEQANVGARSSVLRRLASSGEDVPGAPDAPHPAKLGILDRYSFHTIGVFEQNLQQGVIGRKSWDDVKTDLTQSSPFLKGKPAFWAERIVRTEMMGAYNRGGWEATRNADDQLGDMVKILSATFDDRTGSDSFAVHGQIRRVDEAFESWFGLYQHPPNRPNDREIVVPHRVSWNIPKYLLWRDDGEIVARWKKEKRKGSPPARPLMTTVPLSSFGQPPPKMKDGEGKTPRARVPDDVPGAEPAAETTEE